MKGLPMRLVCVLLLALWAWSPRAVAQPCPAQWLPGAGANGLNGDVLASALLPNGDLIVGGRFSVAGDVKASNIARLDHATGRWVAMGAGTNDEVWALAALPDGSVVAGGRFTEAGGAAASQLARWDGSSWTAFSPAPNLAVRALAVLPGGDLVVGGDFLSVGPTQVNHIARWNEGAGWSALGTGVSVSGAVRCLAVKPDGGVVVGGSFSSAGGVSASNIAQWSAQAGWSALGLGTLGTPGTVHALQVTPNGEVLAGGDFDRAGGNWVGALAKWDGSVWSKVGDGSLGEVRALAVLPLGELIASGSLGPARVARLVGNTWEPLSVGGTISAKTLLALPDGGFVAGGSGTFLTGSQEIGIGAARWDGAAWESLGSAGWEPMFEAFEVLADGTLVGLESGVPVPRLAVWEGAAWRALGGGFSGFVLAVTRLENGQIVAGGAFTSAGGVPANGVARWDGTAWIAMGGGFSAIVSDFANLPSGGLVAAGSRLGGVWGNHVAVWNGVDWSPLGGGVDNDTRALALLPNGDLVAAGFFANAGGVPASRIARWNGSAWLSLGTGLNTPTGTSYVMDLAILPGGDLVATGSFTHAGGAPSPGIARWDGSSWHPLGAGLAPIGPQRGEALAVLPSGELAVGGWFSSAGGVAARNIALWNGSTWSALGAGVDNRVTKVTSVPGGLAVHGVFGVAGEQVSVAFARWWRGNADFDGDGDTATDADIEAFFACLAGNCCAMCGTADFDGDGDTATDADIEAFFRVLAGGAC